MRKQATMHTLSILNRMNKLITEDWNSTCRPQRNDSSDDNLNRFVESKDSFKLKLNLAGASKESINVSLLDNVLTVLAKAEDDVDYHYDCYIPGDKIDIKKTKSKYENGILSVVVPKQAAAKSLSIKVD